MIYEVKATKTYREYINENPNIFDSMSEFSWSEDENRYVNVNVKDETKQLIDDWFGTRIVCSDENFGRFFSRKFNLCALRYAQLSRIELSSFDPLVADYIERKSIRNSNRTSTNNADKTKAGTNESETNKTDSGSRSDTSVRTPDLTTTDSGSRNTTESGSENSDHSLIDNTKDKGMNKIAPQSISYENAVAGTLPSLDWQYATQQDQRENEKSSSVEDNTTRSGQTDETNSNTTHSGGTEENVLNGTTSSTGNIKTDGYYSDTETSNSTITETGEDDDREVKTGRGGLTPQEAFRTAVSYLKTSSAWEWLRRELEDCFFSIYEV